MKKTILLFTSLFLVNAEANQCGSFGEMRSSIEEVLNQRGGNIANYVGSSGSAQVNFNNGRIMVAEGVCHPTGPVCVSGQTVELSVACQGGRHRNIDLSITRLGNSQFRIRGRVGIFSQTQLLHATSFGGSGSEPLFTMDVSPAVTDLEWAQLLIDLDRAERNQRLEQFRNNSRQPASVEVPESPSNSIDI